MDSYVLMTKDKKEAQMKRNARQLAAEQMVLENEADPENEEDPEKPLVKTELPVSFYTKRIDELVRRMSQRMHATHEILNEMQFVFEEIENMEPFVVERKASPPDQDVFPKKPKLKTYPMFFMGPRLGGEEGTRHYPRKRRV